MLASTESDCSKIPYTDLFLSVVITETDAVICGWVQLDIVISDANFFLNDARQFLLTHQRNHEPRTKTKDSNPMAKTSTYLLSMHMGSHYYATPRMTVKGWD